MCGRYGRRGEKQKIAEAFRVTAGLEEVEFTESLDCAPGSVQPVISVSENGERQVSLMRWGFKLPDRLLLNVRAEGVETAKLWKEKFQHQRCIVPATSYFEWQDCDTKPKPKYEIEVLGGGLFGIAGLWAPWRNPKTDQWEDTFSTFTTEPNALIAKIHIRQPVILQPGELGEWLSESERPPLHLLRITPEERMTMTQVSSGSPVGRNPNHRRCEASSTNALGFLHRHWRRNGTIRSSTKRAKSSLSAERVLLT